MGLLDYLNKGFDNSVGHLNDLKNSLANQPKMYDPHANARALMGGQAMQYNQQPQSLIADTTVAQADPSLATAPVDRVDYNFPQLPQQPNQEMIYPNYNQQPDQEVWGGGGYTPEPAPEVAPYNPAMIQPEISPYGSAPQEGLVGVDSTTPVIEDAPYSLLGDPNEVEEIIRLRKEAEQRLPWYLGGKR